MTLKRLELIHWLAAAVWLAIMALTAGCSSARPYTALEKTWLTHAIIGQSLDVVTTDAGLGSGQMSEANPIWGEPDNAMPILIGKAAIMGLAWIYCEWKPDHRQVVWGMFGVSGYALAGWNTYQMIDNDVTPWGRR